MAPPARPGIDERQDGLSLSFAAGIFAPCPSFLLHHDGLASIMLPTRRRQRFLRRTPLGSRRRTHGQPHFPAALTCYAGRRWEARRQARKGHSAISSLPLLRCARVVFLSLFFCAFSPTRLLSTRCPEPPSTLSSSPERPSRRQKFKGLFPLDRLPNLKAASPASWARSAEMGGEEIDFARLVAAIDTSRASAPPWL